MATTEQQPDSTGEPDSSRGHTIDVRQLIKQEGVIPFRGLTRDSSQPRYPALVDPSVDQRFDATDADTFVEAVRHLPNASEGKLWAENEFVSPTADGGVNVNADAIRAVDGLDADEIEQQTGCSLEELIKQGDPEPLVPLERRKNIVDRRRVALNALGFDCRFRWQIASDRYEAGDMQGFLARLVAAAQDHDCEDAFGWVRFRDWGGVVRIVLIYPSMDFEVEPASESDLDIDLRDSSVKMSDTAIDPQLTGDSDDTTADKTATIYYGHRISYDYRGMQKITSTPLYFYPDSNLMIPLPHGERSRKHLGDFMNAEHERDNDRVPPVEWHSETLAKLDRLSTTVNEEIARAMLLRVDFSEEPFNVAEFYELLGVSTDYAESAANRVTRLAEPSHKPSLWNLQVSLKLILIDEYRGSKAADRYQEYQEIASQILRFPKNQVKLALRQWKTERAEEKAEETADSESDLPETQEIDDVEELPGVTTEDELSVHSAQQVDQRVQQRLTDISASQSD
jgi:hypothetical protein